MVNNQDGQLLHYRVQYFAVIVVVGTAGTIPSVATIAIVGYCDVFTQIQIQNSQMSARSRVVLVYTQYSD